MEQIQIKKDVILRLDFLGEIRRSNLLIDNLNKIFPKLDRGEILSLEISRDQNERIQREKSYKRFTFYSPDSDITMTLDPTSIIFNLKKYNNYKEFREIVVKIFQNIEADNPYTRISRIGLRHTNYITIKEGDPFNWDGLIKEYLIYPIKMIDNRNELSRLLGVIELNRSEYFINFQYGWFNSIRPSPIAKREFVLDYDCYSNDEMDFSTKIIDHIDLFNREIEDLTKKSTLGDLQKKMEGDNNVS